MKIIITGATGSLGAFLTRWFAGKGHEVIALGRIATPPAALLKCATYIQADITKPFTLPTADVCIHTAAIADDKAKPADLYNTNVTGTQHVAIAAQHCNTFIHVSSSSVYVHSNDLLTEEMVGERNGEKLSAYGKSKLLAEDILQVHHTNESCFILRPRGIYGPGDKVLLPRLLKLVRNNKMLRAGSMHVQLSMTHFANFAAAVEACMLSGKKGWHTYNVADDRTYILYKIAKQFLSALYNNELGEKTIPLWLLKLLSALHVGDATPLFVNTVSKNMVLDITKIKQELHYAPAYDVDTSLPAIAAWVETIGGVDTLRTARPGLAWIY